MLLSDTEIDVAIEDVDSPAFAHLEAAGIVEVFDRGTTLAGVRRNEDATEDEILDALRAAEEEHDAALAPAILALFEDVLIEIMTSPAR